jgi:hypothetical protein
LGASTFWRGLGEAGGWRRVQAFRPFDMRKRWDFYVVEVRERGDHTRTMGKNCISGAINARRSICMSAAPDGGNAALARANAAVELDVAARRLPGAEG